MKEYQFTLVKDEKITLELGSVGDPMDSGEEIQLEFKCVNCGKSVSFEYKGSLESNTLEIPEGTLAGKYTI